MSTRKQVSKSAKWMTREGGSAGRSNVQAPEILRCLFIELANNGLIVKSIESKLALIQIQNIIESNTQHHTIQNDINSDNIQKINNDITNINNDLNFAETKISKKYSELAKVIEEITLKPTGRIASSVLFYFITYHIITMIIIIIIIDEIIIIIYFFRLLLIVLLYGMIHLIILIMLGKKYLQKI